MAELPRIDRVMHENDPDGAYAVFEDGAAVGYRLADEPTTPITGSGSGSGFGAGGQRVEEVVYRPGGFRGEISNRSVVAVEPAELFEAFVEALDFYSACRMQGYSADELRPEWPALADVIADGDDESDEAGREGRP